MPIVTISRGSYTRGRNFAEKLAEKMGYESISREVLINASEQFNIPEIKLRKALHDAPSTLERFTHGKQKYIAYIKNAILQHMVKDNVIYHGLAGHAFLPKIDHLLRIRVRADLADRVQEEMRRESISEEDARYRLNKDDEERRKWSIFVTGHDPCDPNQYELMLNASSIPIDDMVDIVAQLLQKPYLQATPESQKVVEELAKASEIKAKLVETYPEVEVQCIDQTAVVSVQGSISQEESLARSIREMIKDVQGIENVRVHVVPGTGLAYSAG